MTQLRYYLVIIIIAFCGTSSAQYSLVKFPDSIKSSNKYYSPAAAQITCTWYWGILTIGQPFDSLTWDPYYKTQPAYTIDPILQSQHQKGDDVTLLIDTIQEVDYYNCFSSKEEAKSAFKGLPVYITNLSEREITIKHPKYRLNVIQEALDKEGKWAPIEALPASNTVIPLTVHTLKRGQFIVSVIFKYRGDFPTLLRLKLTSGDKIYYSNPFKGSINYSQIILN